jgi:hypothetical protein
MKPTILVLAAAVLFGAVPAHVRAQTVDPAAPGVTHELRLRDGSRVYGRIAAESAEEVVFETASGVMLTARRDQVVSLRKVEGELRNGEFQPADPNNTRLFFGPTGRSLAKGQTYLGVYEFVMPFVQVGVTDRFSIGGGTPLVFGFDDDGFNRPYWITPKLQVLNHRRAQVSIGVFQGFGGGASGGIAYGVATTGGSAGSFTAGAGVAYDDGGDRAAVVMIGADRQVRRNMKFVTENYVFGSGNGIVSAGVRFFGDRLSADLALAAPLGDDIGGFVFPVVNFVYLF